MKALSGGRLRAERAFTLSEGDRHTLNSTYDKFLTLSQEAEIFGNYFPKFMPEPKNVWSFLVGFILLTCTI